jgi:transposase
MGEARREKLMQLSKEDLVMLIDTILDEHQKEIAGLQAQILELKAEIERLKGPPPNSKNSSMPPSRDFKKSTDGPSEVKKRGAKFGHPIMKRAMIDNPDRVIEAKLGRCICGEDMTDQRPEQVIRRQITEIPEIKAVVIETRQEVCKCPACGKRVCGELPAELVGEQAFGPRLEALVVYLRQVHHISYERCDELLKTFFGVAMSEGGMSSVTERVGQIAEIRADVIQEEIRKAEVVGSDETSARVDGHNYWHWVFVTANAILHVIDKSRSAAVVKRVMGNAVADVWISDCWKPQLSAKSRARQLCLCHQIRNLQKLIEEAPRLRWARQMQALFREAIHLANMRETLGGAAFARRVRRIERKLDKLLARQVRNTKADALLARYRERRDELLVFLHDTRVPAHNNASERALRSSVIHRRVTGGFRSSWGPRAYAALASVIDTAKLVGKTAYEAIIGLCGRPVLQFLAP